MSDFWSACLNRFEKELPTQQYNTWIKTLRLENDSDNPDSDSGLPRTQLRLIAPNRFVLQWVRERYLDQIQNLSKQYFPEPVNISLALGENTQLLGNTPIAATPTATIARSAHADAPVSRAEDSAYEKSRLNPGFTFDTLVTGRANDLARAAAQQVALNPGTSYNPLFIYGGVGLGKTHLIHALGNEVWRHNPDLVIRYVHAEDYFADVVRAYQQKSFDVFKRYYRSLDLLLIDDIQFFNNKNRTQEEFFYAFNALVEAKKQIVITCDTYPKDVTGLEERLVSRFDWGLTVQIEPPEPEMRVAILKKKAEAAKIDLGDDVAFLIAKNLRSNVRELEGALNKVLAYARFHGRSVSIDVAKEALKDIFGAINRLLTLDLIQKTVADYYKLKVAEMYSKKRTRAIARPRQVAMWLARELTHHSLPEIGEAFGGRDHTTVLHACRTITDLRSKDAQLGNDVHVLMQTLKG
ncbi:MAG: chromosomal replication initiator protein DnaA [Rhodocyclaceae bacterium]|nr:MAG: chromosomal replication initiator protein DnaA [Rhodocyclaceae bacterium]